MIAPHDNAYANGDEVLTFLVPITSLDELKYRFMRALQPHVSFSELEDDNELREKMGPGRAYKMKLEGLKSGWTAVLSSSVHGIQLAMVDEENENDVILPSPLALTLGDMSKSLVGRSFAVVCPDGFELMNLNEAEWSSFKQEFWSVMVDRYKKGMYPDACDQEVRLEAIE